MQLYNFKKNHTTYLKTIYLPYHFEHVTPDIKPIRPFKALCAMPHTIVKNCLLLLCSIYARRQLLLSARL